MKEVEENLIEIVNEQLKQCKENKTIPSQGTLDIVKILMTFYFGQPNV